MTFSSVPTYLIRSRSFRVGSIPVGGDHPLVLIAGPCVLEDRAHAVGLGRRIADIAARVGMPLIFKASFDKANRSSALSYRGPGLEKGLDILAEVKAELGVPVLTDVHTEVQAAPAAQVCDILQVPAFLSRQTDFVRAVGRAGKPVNVKKAQFMAPEDMINVVEKLREVGCQDVLLTERGVSFGYHNLVSDFRALATMARDSGLPVCFDATHSVQQPGGLGHASGGRREFVPVLARAACAVGINALFLEVHEDPDNAPSDGPNMLALADLEAVLAACAAIDRALRGQLVTG